MYGRFVLLPNVQISRTRSIESVSYGMPCSIMALGVADGTDAISELTPNTNDGFISSWLLCEQ